MGRENNVKDVFVTLTSSALKALTCDKEGELQEHFIQNLNMQCCQKILLVKQFALTIPVKINGHLVTGSVDTGSSEVFVSQGCADRLGLKKDRSIAYTLSMPNNTLM